MSVDTAPGSTPSERHAISLFRRDIVNRALIDSFIKLGLTLIFMIVVATLRPFGLFANTPISETTLISLLVALIPTTIGALLSAIGIAGMDRLVRRNVLALSGRAVEASGDVDVLLLDKTGTITIGNRLASEFIPMPGIPGAELAEVAQLSSLADETPEGRSIVVLAKQYGIREHDMSHLHAHRSEPDLSRPPRSRLCARPRQGGARPAAARPFAWARLSVPSRARRAPDIPPARPSTSARVPGHSHLARGEQRRPGPSVGAVRESRRSTQLVGH